MNFYFIFYFVIILVLLPYNYTTYVPLEPHQIARLANWTENCKEDIWQISGQFEGDMVLNAEQEAEQKGLSRNGMVAAKYRWPLRTLVYSFHNTVDFIQRQTIQLVLQEFSLLTCVRCRLKNSYDVNYVNVTATDRGCYSAIGFQGGVQTLNLQNPGCSSPGTILHEFVHAFGFYHMQSDPTRDSYVQIYWDNIELNAEGNFQKYSSTSASSFGYRYDYNSIMHYNQYAFSKNDLPTIVTINPRNSTIGQRLGLSNIDIFKLNKMYGCI